MSGPHVRKALQIKGLSVKHLPKMDTFGKCDPFMAVIYNGLEQKTKVLHFFEFSLSKIKVVDDPLDSMWPC
jgi:hypothetical protein